MSNAKRLIDTINDQSFDSIEQWEQFALMVGYILDGPLPEEMPETDEEWYAFDMEGDL